jgi:hypothetical protein
MATMQILYVISNTYNVNRRSNFETEIKYNIRSNNNNSVQPVPTQ